jgi:hypothetical protein
MSGKGDKPRNCFSKQFKNNYDEIDWGNFTKKQVKFEEIEEDPGCEFCGLIYCDCQKSVKQT